MASPELYVGIDLGGTAIKGAAADRTGRIVRRQEIPTEAHEGPDAVIARMGRMARELGDGAVASGIGIPGLIDFDRGVTRFLPNFPTNWRGVAVTEPLQKLTGRPVRILNDARCAALGEMTFGHGRGRPDLTFAYFTLGTGVGGAVAIDGKLRLGPLGAAGELGHLNLVPDGLPCGCGRRGCLETLASGPAIVGEALRLVRSGQSATLVRLAEANAGNLTPKLVADAALAGDPAAIDLIARVAGYLAIAVADITTVIDPQLVVFAGGVAQMGDLLLDPLRRLLARPEGMCPTDRLDVCISALGNDSGVLGGVALAIAATEVKGGTLP
jgi:glucokinase